MHAVTSADKSAGGAAIGIGAAAGPLTNPKVADAAAAKLRIDPEALAKAIADAQGAGLKGARFREAVAEKIGVTLTQLRDAVKESIRGALIRAAQDSYQTGGAARDIATTYKPPAAAPREPGLPSATDANKPPRAPGAYPPPSAYASTPAPAAGSSAAAGPAREPARLDDGPVGVVAREPGMANGAGPAVREPARAPSPSAPAAPSEPADLDGVVPPPDDAIDPSPAPVLDEPAIDMPAAAADPDMRMAAGSLGMGRGTLVAPDPDLAPEPAPAPGAGGAPARDISSEPGAPIGFEGDPISANQAPAAAPASTDAPKTVAHGPALPASEPAVVVDDVTPPAADIGSVGTAPVLNDAAPAPREPGQAGDSQAVWRRLPGFHPPGAALGWGKAEPAQLPDTRFRGIDISA